MRMPEGVQNKIAFFIKQKFVKNKRFKWLTLTNI